MRRATLTNHIDAFKNEAFMLLRFQLAFNRIKKFENIRDNSRSDFVDKLISLKALENDILMRVCKIDDDIRGVHSFKNAKDEISKTHINRIEIETKMLRFSQIIEKAKKQRRHTQLAHLKIGTLDKEFYINYDFIPVIKLIVEIIDLMNKDKVNYQWQDGSQEKFDLRLEVIGEVE